ncbi:MAG: hypothetical protein E7589_04370 [Ruminococcaceae bacterium]|nr:hypothetical protein [Oscillospiraceae bacterium]
MAIRQISVFLENHSGSLSAVTRVLAEAGADMRAMAVADTQDFGILRLIVRDTDGAIAALKAHGYLTSTNEVTAAVIPDEPGGLCHLVNILADEDVNIEYSYAFLTPEDGKACVVFRVADNDHAAKAFHNAGIGVLDADGLTILD